MASTQLLSYGNKAILCFSYGCYISIANCKQVPSYEMLGIPKYEEEVPPTPAPQPQHPLSPMGEACSRMDLTAIHQILVNTHYRDDEGTNEVNIIAFLLLSADVSTG